MPGSRGLGSGSEPALCSMGAITPLRPSLSPRLPGAEWMLGWSHFSVLGKQNSGRREGWGKPSVDVPQFSAGQGRPGASRCVYDLGFLSTDPLVCAVFLESPRGRRWLAPETLFWLTAVAIRNHGNRAAGPRDPTPPGQTCGEAGPLPQQANGNPSQDLAWESLSDPRCRDTVIFSVPCVLRGRRRGEDTVWTATQASVPLRSP